MKDRFLSKVNKTETCWLWTGSVEKKNGYAVFWHINNNRRASRISYELYKEKIPDGLIIRHKCDNPLCVNPEHLETGTQKDNMSDMIERGRRKGNIKLNDSQVKEIKELLKLGRTQRNIAMQFGISQSTVMFISTGRRWINIS